MARRTSEPGTSAPDLAGASSYWRLSVQPLHVLVFLLPLLALYEIGSVLYLRNSDGILRDLAARKIISDFFESFGIAGLHAPAILLVTILLVWHLLNRDAWRIRLPVIAGMALEAIVWTIPLLVMLSLMSRIAGQPGVEPLASSLDDLLSASWQARATLAFGAGLYEDLLCRLIAIALVHFVAADLLRLPDKYAAPIAVAGSALSFILLHDVTGASGNLDWPWIAQLAASGVFLAALYLARGFGIVVATHACYDIVVLVLVGNSGS